jgi:superfamily I DNA/RNA helicase
VPARLHYAAFTGVILGECVAGFSSTADEISGLAEWLSEGMKAKEIAIFGRTESVLHDRVEPAVEAAGQKGQPLNDDDPADEDRISVGTMHRAKGLEFKAVAVVGCGLGILPVAVGPRCVHG